MNAITRQITQEQRLWRAGIFDYHHFHKNAWISAGEKPRPYALLYVIRAQRP